MYTWTNALGKVETGTWEQFASYAEMAWDAMGFRPTVRNADDVTIEYKFSPSGHVVRID